MRHSLFIIRDSLPSEGLGSHFSDGASDGERSGCSRRRNVQNVQHPAGRDKLEIVNQRAIPPEGLSANPGTAGDEVLLADFREADAGGRGRRRAWKTNGGIRPTPLRQCWAAIRQNPGKGQGRAEVEEAEVGTAVAFATEGEEAFGPASTVPLMRRVKWTPRNGKRGSGTG